MKYIKSISTMMLLCLFTLSMSLQAQNDRTIKNNEKRAEKMVEKQGKQLDKIIAKLELNDAEKAKFVPLYEKYQDEKLALRQVHKKDKSDRGEKKMTDLSDAELENIIQDSFKAEEANLALKRKYHNDFKSILPMKKVAKLYFLEKRNKGQKFKEKNGKNRGPRDSKKMEE